ncbi:MAG: beta-lactamase family protein [Chloroflexi bacterium]|nr:beta-lactamase family protein [Chloroflexota bacterium]
MLRPFGPIRLLVILMLVALFGAPAPPIAASVPHAGLTPTAARADRGPRDPAELTRFLDDFFRVQLAQEHIAGAAVVVVRDGAVLAARGYGYADVERHIPVDPERTVFATGSTGKLFTWIAVMQQVERGAFDLDTDVNRYLQELDPRVPATYPEPVTLRHLLTHTAGFDNLAGIYTYNERELVSAGLYLRAHTPPRVRPPGELAAYSNYGAALAAYLVEATQNQPFVLYAEEQIFTPLQMDSTTLRQPLPAALAERASLGYRYADGVLTVMPEGYIRLEGAGESHATAADMGHLLIALLQHGQYGEARLFGEATGRQMLAQLFTHDPRVSGMGYGLAEATLNGQRVLKHNGVVPNSFNSILALLPTQGVGIYASYNSNGTFAPGEQLLQAFLDHYYPSSSVAPMALPDARTVAAQMAGTYRASNSFATSYAKLMAVLPGSGYADVTLTAGADGRVTSTGLGPQPLRWVPVAPDVLRRADGRQDTYGDLVFGADDKGRLTRLYLQNNPFRAYERVPWYATGAVGLSLLAGSSVIMLSALLGWPLAALLRRRAGPAHRTVRQVRLLLGIAAALCLLFLPALALSVPEAISVGPTLALRAALWLPLLAVPLLLAAGWLTVRGWGTKGWGVLARAHTVLVLLAGLSYLWLLWNWNLLGFHFV